MSGSPISIDNLTELGNTVRATKYRLLKRRRPALSVKLKAGVRPRSTREKRNINERKKEIDWDWLEGGEVDS